MATERYGAVTFKGTPKTVVGNQLKAGDKLPAVTLVANDLSPVDLSSFEGSVRLVSVVPSLDTGICDAQTRRFNEEVGKLQNVKFLTISTDLPWAQKRWVADAEVANVTTLSDHRDLAFGDAAGTHIKEMRIEQRSVFVVDRDGTVTYAEYVPEVAQHPDYDKALDALNRLV